MTSSRSSTKVVKPLHFQAEIEAQKKVVLKMADDVEADLEAPEALDIAKEDILLSKMDQERERYAARNVCRVVFSQLRTSSVG